MAVLDYNKIFRDYGLVADRYRSVPRYRDKQGTYKKFKDINENPGKYSAKEIEKIFRQSVRVREETPDTKPQFYRNIGSDDDDYVLDTAALGTAQNALDLQLNRLLISARSAAPKPKPKPKPVAKAAPPKVKNPYQAQIAELQKKLAIQTKARPTAADRTKKVATQRAEAAADRARKVDAQRADSIAKIRGTYERQIDTLKSGFQSQTADLIKKYGLQISGLQTDFGSQLGELKTGMAAQQKSFEESLAEQNALFGRQLEESQVRADRNMRAQQASQTANIQLGGRDEQLSRSIGGTQAFKRRPRQFNIGSYGALSGIRTGISGAVNI